MIVKETINHGDYRAVREVEMEETSVGEVAMMLADCTYLHDVAVTKVARVASDLATEGRAELGWVRWEVSA